MSDDGFPSAYFGQEDTRTLSREAVLRRLAPFKRPLKAFIEALPQGASVLDVGCGQGKTLKMMLALRPDLKLSGMDMSDVSAHLPKGVGFKKGKVSELTTLYKGEQFDAIVCQHVIEHLLYPMELLDGVTALLKNGGRLFIETPNWTRLIAPFSHFYFYNDYTHVRPFSRTSMSRLLLDYNYSQVTIKTISSCSWFPQGRLEGDTREKASAEISQNQQGLGARILARLLNPLMRDVLIATATKNDN